MTAATSQAAWDALRRERDDLLLAIDRCEETKTALHLNLRAMRDERDALAQQVEMMRGALADTAQTLAWTQHGTCRGFSEWLLSTNAALDNAKHALALPNTAADILKKRDALTLREMAERLEDYYTTGGAAVDAVRIIHKAANEIEAKNG